MKEQMQAYAARAERALEKYVGQMKSQSGDMTLDRLFAAMEHSLNAGGKRIRPVLIYAFCEACGGSPDAADAAACAMEMTHTSSLIFDDLPAMDDDDMRRGKPSCHKAFGEAVAILAGDALICAPFAILAGAREQTADQRLALVRELAEQEGACGMIGGQIMDMLFEERDSVTAEELSTMCLGKTGALMAAACRMGCICAGASDEQMRAAGEYGRSLGLAFQIVDDILDVIGNAELLGKPVGSDANEDKKTFVTVLGIEKAREKAAQLTENAHRQLEMFENADFLHKLTDALLVRMM